MSNELREQIGAIGQGDHICLIYDNPVDQMAAVVPFIKEGLARQECCLYVVDDRTQDEVVRALCDEGIDVAEMQRLQALLFFNKRDAYLRDEMFDPGSMIAFLRESTDERVRQGFSGVRITGEMTWAIGCETGCNHLLEYEALLNQFFPGSRACAICQYNSKRLPPEVIRDVLKTHPIAILGSLVCPNIYYEPPAIALGHSPVADQVIWMTSQLIKAREAQYKIELANKRLSEADRRKDEFLAMLAHELRNPLAPVQSGVELIQLSHMDTETQEICKAMERQIEHIVHLLNDLLDVARITHNQIMLKCQPTDLRHIIREAATMISPAMGTFSQQLLIKLPQEPLMVNVDPTRVAQVVSNLLHNSSKFSPHGGKITIAAGWHGHKVWCRVRDEGAGIDAETLPHIFDLFVQSKRDLARTKGGLGIGLSIAKTLIERHGGDIAVKSAGPGTGAEFTFSLPLHSEVATVASAPSEAQGATNQELRVLVVDDNLDAARMLTRFMIRRGHQVKEAKDGIEALELASAWQPNLILMDLGLPKLDGYETMKRLRLQPTFDQTMVVAVSGYGQNADRDRSQTAGFDDHLVKPVTLKTIDKILAKAWEHFLSGGPWTPSLAPVPSPADSFAT